VPYETVHVNFRLL